MSASQPQTVVEAPATPTKKTSRRAQSAQRMPIVAPMPGAGSHASRVIAPAARSHARASSSPPAKAAFKKQSTDPLAAAKVAAAEDQSVRPGTSQARRCLDRELDGPQVFNIAVGDHTEQAHTLGGSTKAHVACSITHTTDPAKQEPPCVDIAATETMQEDDQVDAWSLEHWDSPSSVVPSSRSPCCSAQSTLDEPMREVADVVRSELLVDLDAMVHRAVSQMSSWLSSEIAFARQGLHEATESCVDGKLITQPADAELRTEVEELKRATELQAQEIRRVQAELSGKLGDLQSSLDAQTQELRLLETACPAGSRDQNTSNSVAEARMLAEERRWRLKLDAVQDSLDKQSAGIESLQKRSSGLEAKLAAHDAESRRGASVIQRVETQVADLQSQLRVLQPGLDKQTEKVQSLAKLSENLENKLSAISEEVTTTASALAKTDGRLHESEVAWLEFQANITKQIEQLGEQAASLVEEVHAQGVGIEQNIEMTRGVKTQTDANEEQCLQLRQRVCVQEEAVSTLLDQSSGFTEKLAAHGAEICSAEALARKIQSQVQAAEKERLAELRVVCEKLETQNDAVSTLSKKIQTQINDVEEGLVRALADLSTETSRRLEDKVGCGMLDEALDLRDQRVADVASQLAELMAGDERINRRMADLARLAEALDSRDVRFDALREELREGLADSASAAQLEQATETLRSWVEEVRETLRAWSQKAHQNTAAELEHARSLTSEHGVMLKRHSHLLENITTWCQQVRVREQGLTHVIMHVVEKSSPEQLKMFEEVLSVPQLRRV
mmetsp:Transcript_36277/g.91348  ORF Transcript_36277/g.91348 Transcript_36277/m.91348 type:complete len:790 (-) Transcript_36277:48-2417(-)